MAFNWGGAGAVGSSFGVLPGLAAGFLMPNAEYHNPADVAAQYYNQVPGTIKPYYEPYVNAGQKALPQLTNTYNQLTTNPSGYLNNLSQGYQESPGYQFRLNEALNAGNNAAAAGGMAGSLAHQRQNSGIAEGLASQDYDQWLNHVLGLYGKGLTGQEGLETQGYDASTNLAKNLAQALIGQGNLGYLGQENKNEYENARQRDMYSAISGLGSMFSSLGSLI